MTPSEETTPKITDVKRDLQTVKEFRIILLRELQEHKTINKIRKIIREQNEKFNK